jgi:hypothetical protein
MANGRLSRRPAGSTRSFRIAEPRCEPLETRSLLSATAIGVNSPAAEASLHAILRQAEVENAQFARLLRADSVGSHVTEAQYLAVKADFGQITAAMDLAMAENAVGPADYLIGTLFEFGVVTMDGSRLGVSPNAPANEQKFVATAEDGGFSPSQAQQFLADAESFATAAGLTYPQLEQFDPYNLDMLANLQTLSAIDVTTNERGIINIYTVVNPSATLDAHLSEFVHRPRTVAY